jgi:hypothetical protein
MSSQPQDYRNKVILSALLAPVLTILSRGVISRARLQQHLHGRGRIPVSRDGQGRLPVIR